MNQPFGIRLATSDDRGDLLRFLDEHWKRNHAFVVRPDLFDWQHVSRQTPGEINFVLARREMSGEIMGVLGFIPFSHFDPGSPCGELALAIWKVREDAGAPGLGLQLLRWLLQDRSPTMVCAIGLSPMVIPIYKAIGFVVGVMDHHVLFRQAATRFTIGQGVQPSHCPPRRASDPGVKLLTVSSELPPKLTREVMDELCAGRMPRKSWSYVVNRYVRHPIYRYAISAVLFEALPRAVLVWRRVEVDEGAVLRIVDVLGDDTALARCGGVLQKLLDQETAEYIDVYHHGLSTEALARAGFCDRRAEPGLIVPNYFEPFERRNVEIAFAYRLDDSARSLPVRLLRGDSDQDRPNQFGRTATAG